MLDLVVGLNWLLVPVLLVFCCVPFFVWHNLVAGFVDVVRLAVYRRDALVSGDLDFPAPVPLPRLPVAGFCWENGVAFGLLVSFLVAG